MEGKTVGGKLSKMQTWIHRRLETLRFHVEVVRSKEDVDNLF